MQQEPSKFVALFPATRDIIFTVITECGSNISKCYIRRIPDDSFTGLSATYKTHTNNRLKYDILIFRRLIAVLIMIAFVSIFQTSCGHAPENRIDKISTTVKSPPAIETPAVSEEMEKISKIKWDTGRPETTEKLLEYLEHWQEDDVQYAVAEALALRDDSRVFGALMEVYSNLRRGRRTIKAAKERSSVKIKISKFMVIYYAACPSMRHSVINFLVTVVPSPSNQLNRVNCYGHWQGLSGADFIGNESLRELIIFVQRLREWNGDGSEIDVRKMTQPVIKDILPEFPLTLINGRTIYYDWQMRRKGQRFVRKNWQKVTDDDIAEAEITIFEKDASDGKLINAVQVLLEASPFTREERYQRRLMELLNDSKRGDSLKRTIIAAFGSEMVMPDDVRDILLRFINQGSEELVIGAAKALRWKRGVPVEPLIERRQVADDYQVKIELESALATITDGRIFPILLKAICETKPHSENIIKRRVDNLKLWYVLLGNERDDLMASLLNDLPQEKQDSLIFWLRDTSTFAFFRGPPGVAHGWFATIEDKSDGISPLVPQEIREIFISLSADFPV